MARRDIYETVPDPQTKPVLDELRRRISHGAGVTLTGNRLTVRWREGGRLVEVHSVVLWVEDGYPKEPGT